MGYDLTFIRFRFAIVVILSFCWCQGAAVGKERPNIVLLFADDQRADTIAAHGNAHIATPNLDRLANEGYSFLRNYCAGSYSGAVCVASRSMLMTGCHWMRIKQLSDVKTWQGLRLLPELLHQEAGYECFAVGKWHNGTATLTRAFQQGRSIYLGGMANHADFQVQDLIDGELTARRPAGGFSSEVFANEAIAFLRKRSTENPFFLYVAFTAPHDPRNPPLKYREKYYRNRPPLPPNFLPLHPFANAPQAVSGRDESLAPWPRTPEIISEQLCEYYGLITHLDEQVGRILQALDALGLSDNTYVIYTADHGLAMGSHGLLGKQNIYEQSMRCPLIIRGPGIPAGESTTRFSYVHDVYATICGFAGVELPAHADSRDLSIAWRRPQQPLREVCFLPFQDNQRAISDGRWKLHVYPRINHRLLFDLQADPHEKHDLAGDPAYAQRVDQLLALMRRQRQELGDTDPLQVDEPAPKIPEYDNTKRVKDKWQPQWIRAKYFGDS